MTNAGGPSPTEQLAGVSKGQNFALTTHSPKTVSFRKKPENAAFGNKGGGAGGGSMGITKLELPTPSVPSDADDGKDACHDDEDAPSPESGEGQAQKPTELGKYERFETDFVMLSG
jgi:hypothetical protein